MPYLSTDESHIINAHVCTVCCPYMILSLLLWMRALSLNTCSDPVRQAVTHFPKGSLQQSNTPVLAELYMCLPTRYGKWGYSCLLMTAHCNCSSWTTPSTQIRLYMHVGNNSITSTSAKQIRTNVVLMNNVQR